MNYEVVFKKKVLKGVRKLTLWGQKKVALLAVDLRDNGPEQPQWQEFCKPGKQKYRCLLRPPSFVACWRQRKNSPHIEVEYVGSREKAPY